MVILGVRVENYLANIVLWVVILQQNFKLDRIGDRILFELESNGRISNAELAEKVGLSASACLRRVQDMERSGLIKGYRAVFDRQQLGVGLVAYVSVGLSDHSKAAQEAFEQAITLSKEVSECHNITGASEYLLRVETQDMNTYKHFHTQILGAIPQVTAITTYVVMGSPKDNRA